MKFKLGKLPKRHDERTLMLADYIAALPPVPVAADWSGGVPAWGMMLNDALGDCTCAAAGHLLMLWTSVAGGVAGLFTPADSDILTAYEAAGGYDPANPASDQGAVELDVLKLWRTNGIAGHKIYAFAEVNVENSSHVQASVALFGGLYIGVQMPSSALSATNAGQDWTDTTDTDIEGGHAVTVVAYDANFLTVVTWGKLQRMSWAWFNKYCDEAYCVLSPDWIAANGESQAGLNLPQLDADLKCVAN